MTFKIMWLHSHITNASGSSKFLFNVLKILSNFFEITLFVQKPITFFNSEFKKLPIDIIALSNSSTSDLNFWLNFSSEIKKQKLFLKDQSINYDLVISSFFPMNIIAQDLGLKHLQFCFQPYAFFWDQNLIESLPFSKKILLKFYKKLFGKLDLIATKNSDTILTINEGSKNAIEKIYGKKSIPTYMGIDLQKNEPNKNLLNLENHKKIIHTTDWSPLKNTLWLIEQFSTLQTRFSNVTLMITETNIDYSEKNKALKNFLHKNMYSHRKVLRMEFKAGLTLEGIFKAYTKMPGLLPDWVQKNEGLLELRICDYVSGMTDRYAINEHKNLYSADEEN